jgi:hypothetical protein
MKTLILILIHCINITIYLCIMTLLFTISDKLGLMPDKLPTIMEYVYAIGVVCLSWRMFDLVRIDTKNLN